jgi:transcriptional regulator with XRE-family HTH domain
MAHFGKQLKSIREAMGMTQVELAAKMGVSSKRVSDWEGMASATIRGSNYSKLASSLGLTVENLDREWRPQGIQQTIGDPIRRGIPIINKAPAGGVVDYDEISMADSGQGGWYILREGIIDPHAFAVVVKGDSMTPILRDGVIAVFSPMTREGNIEATKEDVPEGNIVFVRFSPDSGKDGCCIARWHRASKGMIRFSKDNKSYKAITCSPEEIVRMAALIRYDLFLKVTKTFHGMEQLQSKGENNVQIEGQIHPDYSQ